MLHSQRRFCLAKADSPEELAEKLTQHTWTSCQAFELGGYIFANDATGADGAQEYGVLRPSEDPFELVQIESITFSWCPYPKALDYIRRILAGEFDGESYARVPWGRFQSPEEHGICSHCA